MNRSIFLLLSSICFFISCQDRQPSMNIDEPIDLFAKENLLAWCIVPFDSVERGPQERAAMLKELGISQLAYDWREKHLPTFPEEVQALRENDIGLKSVWFWVNDPDTIIDANNEKMLQMMKDNQVLTELWLCISQNVFEGLSESETLAKAVEVVDAYYQRARDMNCNVALYNHGDWFGEPANQIKIIKEFGKLDITLVYNFHHAHLQLDAYPELLKMMKPHLKTVNINGMKKDGPKILTVGEGDLELEMLKQLKDSGFQGNIGILGHIETEDVEVVLKRNLEGLEILAEKMKGKTVN